MNLTSKYPQLLAPVRLYTRSEILVRDCPVPRQPGVYAWYFRQAPPRVPVEGCHVWEGMPLLYVGISPKRPSENGYPPSRQRLRQRVRYHLRGNAEGSTLRLTLGCLLRDQLGIQLRRVGSGTRRTFADGEDKLSEWMAENARVAWIPSEEPWVVEHELIEALILPLNLEHNTRCAFHAALARLRAESRLAANEAPVWRAV